MDLEYLFLICLLMTNLNCIVIFQREQFIKVIE